MDIFSATSKHVEATTTPKSANVMPTKQVEHYSETTDANQDTQKDQTKDVKASLEKTVKELNEQMAILLISHDVGTISFFVKTIACVNRYVHHHPSNVISEEQLASYNCPLQIITHGTIPHTVLKEHHEHDHHEHRH